jgi:isocitrate lyase
MFDQIQNIVEKKIAADSKAFELQSSFVEDYAKRQNAFMTEFLAVVTDAAKGFGEVKSVGAVIEKQVAVGEVLKEKLVHLVETNGAEVKKLQAALADVYAIALPDVTVPAKKVKKAA